MTVLLKYNLEDLLNHADSFKPLPISPQLLRWTQAVVFQFCEVSHTVYAVLAFQRVPTVRKNT